MKKILIVLLVLIASVSLFADGLPPVTVSEYEGITDAAYYPTSVRSFALGSSGTSAANRMDALSQNASQLAQGRFGLSLPSFGITVYNIASLLENNADDIADIMSGADNENAPLNIALSMLQNIGVGKNKLMTIDFGAGATLGIIGFSGNATVDLHTYEAGSFIDAEIIPEVNAAGTVALGLRVFKSPTLSVDAGVAAHYAYKAYLSAINAASVSAIATSGNTEAIANMLEYETPIMAGSALTFDASATVGFNNDKLRASVVLNNINGKYNMVAYEGAASLVNSIAEGTLPEQTATKEETPFEIKTPAILNLGFAWVPDIIILNPVVTADFLDVIGLFTGEMEKGDLLLHLATGVELNVLKYASVRAGINKGYVSLGAGIALLGMRIDVAYGFQEFGNAIGEKPVDSFSIRFNLGYDRI